jgi:hypothetical protein
MDTPGSLAFDELSTMWPISADCTERGTLARSSGPYLSLRFVRRNASLCWNPGRNRSRRKNDTLCLSA